MFRLRATTLSPLLPALLLALAGAACGGVSVFAAHEPVELEEWAPAPSWVTPTGQGRPARLGLRKAPPTAGSRAVRDTSPRSGEARRHLLLCVWRN
jgi:hypothetical protein